MILFLVISVLLFMPKSILSLHKLTKEQVKGLKLKFVVNIEIF